MLGLARPALPSIGESEHDIARPSLPSMGECEHSGQNEHFREALSSLLVQVEQLALGEVQRLESAAAGRLPSLSEVAVASPLLVVSPEPGSHAAARRHPSPRASPRGGCPKLQPHPEVPAPHPEVPAPLQAHPEASHGSRRPRVLGGIRSSEQQTSEQHGGLRSSAQRMSEHRMSGFRPPVPRSRTANSIASSRVSFDPVSESSIEHFPVESIHNTLDHASLEVQRQCSEPLQQNGSMFGSETSGKESASSSWRRRMSSGSTFSQASAKRASSREAPTTTLGRATEFALTKQQATLAAALTSSDQQAAVLFSEAGFFSRFWSDKRFLTLVLDSAMGIIIVLNCLCIGVSSDVGPTWRGWLIVDSVFACIFLAEVVMQTRLQGTREYFLGVDRRWHAFEVALVVLAVFELILALADPSANEEDSSASNFSLFRILRLVRITRLFRVCRLAIFCDLIVMVKGTLGGLKTLVWSTVLISLPLYAVSLLFRETLGRLWMHGEGAEEFKTVPKSLFTIFRCVVAGECTDEQGRPIFSLVVQRYGWSYGLVYATVEVFMTFGLFNVIVAIFVENVLAGAKTNDQLMRRQRLRDQVFWGQKMLELSTLIVETNRKMEGRQTRDPITSEQLLYEAQALHIIPALFEELRHNSLFSEILRDLDVCEEDWQNLFDTLDADVSGSIDMDELLVGIEKLRGDARRSDIVSVNLKIGNMASQFQLNFANYLARLNQHDEILQKVLAKIP